MEARSLQESRPLLTIAIPTYDRNESLNKTLAVILPQLTADCRLLIIDNASKVPVQTTSSSVLEALPQYQVSILRNRFNISGPANVMRCFEMTDTDYLWILSDDDEVSPFAINTIIKTIQEHPKALFIEFYNDKVEKENDVIVHGVHELLNVANITKTDIIFLSSKVYKAQAYQENIKLGYHYLYSMAPHTALLLATVGMHGECLFSKCKIIKNILPDGDQCWPLVPFVLGLNVILEIPLTWNEKCALSRLIIRGNLIYIASRLAFMSMQSKESKYNLYIFRQIRCRYAPFIKPQERALNYILYILLHKPRILLLLRKIACGILPKKYSEITGESWERF